MTDTGMANMTPDQRHLETLRSHGAQVTAPDGSRRGLDNSFVEGAVNSCIRMNCNAVTYDLFLPGIDEPMMVAIWRDGHIDSGSVKSICSCLAAR